ncbi:hypothetical protein LTR85_009572 [Meristemomyces frigidus]|nr:hypothetical protein LTR85_009572 [Meristemomyces frigidus]
MAANTGAESAQVPAKDFDKTTEDIVSGLSAMQLSADQAKNAPAPTTGHSALLRLPKELRLLIYDALFELFVQTPEHFDTYMLPSEWSKTKLDTDAALGTYASMLLTCKQLYSEAKAHFEACYLPKVTVYFYDVFELLDFTEAIDRVAKLEPKYHDIKICLSSCPTNAWFFTSRSSADKLDAFEAVRDVKEGVHLFTDTQPRFGYTVSEGGPICDPDDRRGNIHPRRAPYSEANSIEIFSTHIRWGKNIDLVRRTVQGSVLTLSIHQICGHQHTKYTQMTAPVSMLYCAPGYFDSEEGMYTRPEMGESRERCDNFLTESSTEIEHARLASLLQPCIS